jgi:1-aminocyclopropane-1-carboxylate deaminase
LKIITQKISLLEQNVELFIRREDLIHPYISGNKFRKLKYNLIEAKKQNFATILTFGGAYSNHIAATAFAANQNGFKSIGVIRGDELVDKIDENSTLAFAKRQGMIFKFISRADYNFKTESHFIKNLEAEFGRFYLLPEGGANDLAVKGCEEILTSTDAIYDYICTCVGTGGTIAGIVNSSFSHQKILGFPALKGDFLQKDICKFAVNSNWELVNDYHFGGYAKVNAELINFMNSFFCQHHILLDPIYTAKMIFGVLDLIQKKYFVDNSKILLIHTGGLQGIEGMNIKLKQKNATTIKTVL